MRARLSPGFLRSFIRSSRVSRPSLRIDRAQGFDHPHQRPRHALPHGFGLPGHPSAGHPRDAVMSIFPARNLEGREGAFEVAHAGEEILGRFAVHGQIPGFPERSVLSRCFPSPSDAFKIFLSPSIDPFLTPKPLVSGFPVCALHPRTLRAI